MSTITTIIIAIAITNTPLSFSAIKVIVIIYYILSILSSPIKPERDDDDDGREAGGKSGMEGRREPAVAS
jgi:hypothetical protein